MHSGECGVVSDPAVLPFLAQALYEISLWESIRLQGDTQAHEQFGAFSRANQQGAFQFPIPTDTFSSSLETLNIWERDCRWRCDGS